jgi:hypothetical protein
MKDQGTVFFGSGADEQIAYLGVEDVSLQDGS